jgi:hypothetical protein
MGSGGLVCGLLKGRLEHGSQSQFDFDSEEAANCASVYVRERTKNGNVPVRLDKTLLSERECDCIEAFVSAFEEDRVAQFLNGAKKVGDPDPKVFNAKDVRGVLCDGGKWYARVRVQDVGGTVSTFRLPSVYDCADDAGLAYDYATSYFCNLIGQKLKHKLNSPNETISPDRQIELRTYVEEKIARSYTFKVGRTVPVVRIVRGVDSEGHGEGESVWRVRLGFQNGPHFFVIAYPCSFRSEQKAALSRDHLMGKVQSTFSSRMEFTQNYIDGSLTSGRVIELDKFFLSIASHPAFVPISSFPGGRGVGIAASASEPKLEGVDLTIGADCLSEVKVGKSVNGLHGVVYMGFEKYMARVSIFTSEGKTVLCSDPCSHKAPRDAALAYDCLTRFLHPYRRRPSPLNFGTCVASDAEVARLRLFFEEHILTKLPVLPPVAPGLGTADKSGKMTCKDPHEFFKHRKTQGPIHPCSCCRRTWFERSIRRVTTDFESKLQSKVADCLTGLIGPNGYENVCHGCYKHLCAGRRPKLNPLNLPDFPVMPDALEGMTDMENHLVAPRIPFIKIYSLPRGGQRGVHGGMVNVPTNLTKTQQQLPRQLHSRESITVNLNPRVCFKGSYKSSGVRPARVVKQLQYLASRPLYTTLGVTLDKTWLPETLEILENGSLASNACKNEEEDESGLCEPSVVTHDLSKKLTLAEEDALRREWDETGEFDDEIGSKAEETSPTMLDQLNSAEEFLNQALVLAPGEGLTPMGLFSDKHCEEASFPNIYCGEIREFPKHSKISFFDRARWGAHQC